MKAKIRDLIMDEKLLELRPINLFVVSRYRQSMRTGAIFPPLIIEKGTMRVISGNHRLEAYRGEYSGEREIEVVEETYKNEAEAIRRFAEENSRHGNPLSGIEKKNIIQKLLEHGDSLETVSQVLNMPVKRVEQYAGFNVVVIGKGNKRELKPVKHGLQHIAGMTMKAKEYTTHIQHDRGVPAKSLAQQLTRWIKNGWIDREDVETMDALNDLSQAISTLFGEQDAA